jgi:hypothetical protein
MPSVLVKLAEMANATVPAERSTPGAAHSTKSTSKVVAFNPTILLPMLKVTLQPEGTKKYG